MTGKISPTRSPRGARAKAAGPGGDLEPTSGVGAVVRDPCLAFKHAIHAQQLLERNGFVRRVRSDNDRRNAHLFLTPGDGRWRRIGCRVPRRLPNSRCAA